MSKMLYFLRREDSALAEKDLIQTHNLKECFQNKDEKIFKSDQMLIDFKPRYTIVLIYDGNDSRMISDVNMALS